MNVWGACEAVGFSLWSGVDLSLVMAGFGFETVWRERRIFVVDGVDIPAAQERIRRSFESVPSVVIRG